MAGQQTKSDPTADVGRAVSNVELTRWQWNTVHSALATANHRRREDRSAFGEEADAYEIADSFRRRLSLATMDMNREMQKDGDHMQTFMMAVTGKIATAVVDALREERKRHMDAHGGHDPLARDAEAVARRVASQANVEAEWLAE